MKEKSKILRRIGVNFGQKLLAILAIFIVAINSPAHAAKWYVDNKLGEVGVEEKVTPEVPHPVQLLFEFQRNGEFHKGATKQLQPWAIEDLQKSGVFSEVGTEPREGGAVLRITFNNVVEKQDLDKAKKDGFRAGLGFGLFGGVFATDNYVVHFEYKRNSESEPIVTIVEHALHMKFGKKEVDIDATQVKNVNAAVRMVVSQAMARGSNNLASNPAFAD